MGFMRKKTKDPLLDIPMPETYGINPAAFAAEWGAEGTPIVYTNSVLSYANELKERLPEGLRDFSGAGFEYLNSLAHNLGNLEKLQQLPNSTRHVKEKAASILLGALTKDVSNLGTLFTVLIAAGVIHGAAAGVITPVFSIAVAAGAWAAVGFAAVRLYRASRSYYSNKYWFKNHFKKYKKMAKKINKLETSIANLQEKLNAAADAEKLEIEKKIADKRTRIEGWVNKQEKIKHRAIAIAQVSRQNGKPISDELIDKFDLHTKMEIEETEETRNYRENYRQENFRDTHNEFAEVIQNNDPSPATERLIAELKLNQRDVMISRGVTLIGMSIAAAGATLLAIAPFTAHAAPVLIGVGLGLTVLGSAIMFGNTYGMRMANWIARKHRYGQERNELHREYTFEQRLANPGLMHLKEDIKLKYRLSFENNQEALGKKYSQLNNQEVETAWYAALDQMKPGERKRLLNTVEKKVFDNKILSDALGETDSENMAQLSAASKLQIINRHARSGVVHSLAATVKSGFTHTASAATELFHHAFSNKAKELSADKTDTEGEEGIGFNDKH